ncbi:unnamed protein product [Callosobruchus maculatus]|uniref:Uncharacterized protein n=1 Tax=Callosobruchus maculatus TaxID=64391 RepID=A0A653CR91_CALMS|nr:unnamed protein product [Callosobruchus maculatus]
MPVECALPELSIKELRYTKFCILNNSLLTLLLDDYHALYLRS